MSAALLLLAAVLADKTGSSHSSRIGSVQTVPVKLMFGTPTITGAGCPADSYFLSDSTSSSFNFYYGSFEAVAQNGAGSAPLTSSISCNINVPVSLTPPLAGQKSKKRKYQYAIVTASNTYAVSLQPGASTAYQSQSYTLKDALPVVQRTDYVGGDNGLSGAAGIFTVGGDVTLWSKCLDTATFLDITLELGVTAQPGQAGSISYFSSTDTAILARRSSRSSRQKIISENSK